MKSCYSSSCCRHFSVLSKPRDRSLNKNFNPKPVDCIDTFWGSCKMDDDLLLWRRQARSYQQSCCNSLGDRTYDKVDENQLALKVGYAIYNSPTDIDDKKNVAVYTKSQKNHISLICHKIKSLQTPEEGTFFISYLYVVIRFQNKKNIDGIQVLFRVPRYVNGKPHLDSHIFIDPKPRKYETWNDYLRNNKLPKCYMCYPVNGIYSITDKSVDINFGMSPACNTSTAVFTGLDISSTLLLVGATGVSLASLALPIALPVVWGATATVFASGTYETARNVYRLHDISKHGESVGLKNPDSRSAWLSLASSVVGMASIGTTAIARGAVAAESAISGTGIISLRVLNVSSLAISGIGVINGIITLVMKQINGTLEPVDILQFTSACFFFLNAVITYNLANRLIEELASSDLTNFFNVRENSNFRISKDIIEYCDSTTYNVVRQLVLGVKSFYCPDICIDDLESAVFAIVALLQKKTLRTISWEKLFRELTYIIQKVWKRYETVIMKVVEEIKNMFEISYWQQLIPRENSTNLEVLRQMCEEIDKVITFCNITVHSNEHRNLMTFARAFSSAHGNPTYQEFIYRFKFYCDCIIAQYREEREYYENEFDIHSSEPNFDRIHFDQLYGVQGNKNEFFFTKALNKVNHPDFLGNIDELYQNLPRKNNISMNLPYLQTNKSSIYTFCGPLHQKELTDEYYWMKAVDLTGFKIECDNSTLNKKDNLVIILPKTISDGEKINNEIDSLEAILIYSLYINDCHMGLFIVIFK